MNLHRTGRKADWEKRKALNRNYWQNIAIKTHGIFTPGNLVSGLGFVLVIMGLIAIYQDRLIQGIVLVATGRIMDIFDGLVAEYTGTKSPVGEGVDATVDKLEVAFALPVLVAQSILVPWRAIVIFTQQLVIAVVSLIAKAKKITLHPSKAGKNGTTAQWLAIVLYGIARINQGSQIAAFSYVVANIVFATSLVLGTAALAGYYKDAQLKK